MRKSSLDDPQFCDLADCGKLISCPHYALGYKCCSRVCQQKVFAGDPVSKVKRIRRGKATKKKRAPDAAFDISRVN
jgi:hypothetical protein